MNINAKQFKEFNIHLKHFSSILITSMNSLRLRMNNYNIIQISNLEQQTTKETSYSSLNQNKRVLSLDYFESPITKPNECVTIVGKIDKKSKYVITSRNKPSKTDIELELNILMVLVEELVRASTVTKKYSQLDLVTFKNKLDFVNFIIEILSEVDKRIQKETVFLKVIISFIFISKVFSYS